MERAVMFSASTLTTTFKTGLKAGTAGLTAGIPKSKAGSSFAASASSFAARRSLTTGPSKSGVGILGTDIYMPSKYVSQERLEEFDGMAPGKYTKGLGQERMAFAGPREDINSMALTAVSNLLEKYAIDPKAVGFLGIGTETLVDKSKSTKTHLMRLFESHGNTDIEGVTTVNACYGGTAALFHAADWCESQHHDGRYAIVLAGDIAVYDKGPARPAGGAGIVAMLVGPDAPLQFEPGLRVSHFEDAYDFYKPARITTEYPIVDGHLSNSCYIRAIDKCYERYAAAWERRNPGSVFSVAEADHVAFHLPYTKLVQKSFARLKWNDFKHQQGKGKQGGGAAVDEELEELAEFAGITEEESYTHRPLEKKCLALASSEYFEKTHPSTLAGRQIGNMYCGSLYGGLLSLIAQNGDDLIGQRLLMFSYGSGLAASMFSLKVTGSIEDQRKAADLLARLEAREEAEPAVFEATLTAREDAYKREGFSPELYGDCATAEGLAPGTFFLNGVDELDRREYLQVPRRAAAAAHA